MTLKFRLMSGLVLSLALASAPVSARDWYRGGGYHGGHNYHRGNGIGLGGVLLGAAIVGGVAIAASNNNRYRAYERGYDPRTGGTYEGNGGYVTSPPPGAYQNDGYQNDAYQGEPDGYDRQDTAGGDPVEDCSRAAERQAQGNGGFARVTGIDRVDDIDGGARVRGSVEVSRGAAAPVQRFGFSCSAAYGQVTSLRLG